MTDDDPLDEMPGAREGCSDPERCGRCSLTKKRARTIAHYCASFRARGETPALAIIADRDDAKKLLAAFISWPLPDWNRPETPEPADERRLWLWLWDGFEGGHKAPAFLEDLAAAAGISYQAAHTIWPQILASRALYPNGTLSDGARELLQDVIKRQQPRKYAHEATKSAPAPKAPAPKKESKSDESSRAEPPTAVDGDREDDHGKQQQPADHDEPRR